MITVGSLCSGYGGLELGAQLAFGPLKHLWHAEHDPAGKQPTHEQPAARVLAARWPGVPNLGDIQKLTAAGGWDGLPPVDLLCAGYPCQGESNAGLRKGSDDPRFRWPDVAEAIRALRPRLVFLENVRGHLNRSFPRVVADLAAIGYVGRWHCLRASEIGAPHRRERLYIIAWPIDDGPPADWLRGTAPARDASDLMLLPTPIARDHKGAGAGWGDQPGRPLSETIHRLLPTPRVTDTNGAGKHGDGGLDLRTAVTLLPTPKASDTSTPGRRCSEGFRPPLSQVVFNRWGDYTAAIDRWENLLGRPAPAPTAAGARGGQSLSPRFVEWMMGLPDGWVCDIITPDSEPSRYPARWRTSTLKVLGNGVVPQAAAAALRALLAEPEQPGLFSVMSEANA